MINKTAVVSAFPCCGKTYAFNNFQNRYSILDSDSSKFHWIKDSLGNNTKDYNPDFPNNYIEHIKENIGKADIIFVSAHLEVRQALKDANIRYCTVYPNPDLLCEWVERMRNRNSTEEFITFQINNWKRFMHTIHNEPHGFSLVRLNSNEYLDLDYLYNL